jgi:hypothetical protein
MAINRIKSPYYIAPASTTLGAELSINSYYLSANYEFQSTGQVGTNPGSRYRVHRYDAGVSGTLTFSRGGYIDILLLGAGGQGSWGFWGTSTSPSRYYGSGGGGAGGLLLYYNQEVVANTSYPFSVGTAAPYGTYGSGNNTTFLGYTAIGGGAGGGYNTNTPGASGGSGGGGARSVPIGTGVGGSGTSGQGNAGGSSDSGTYGGGGGGYLTAGATGPAGGAGGSGVTINFDGIDRAIAAGGGCGVLSSNGRSNGGTVDGIIVGGNGGGMGNQAYWTPFNGSTPVAPGCGGGGGGVYPADNNGAYGGAGSNGIMFIRYIV